MVIAKMNNVTYNDFHLDEVINPDHFDTNFSEIVTKIDALIDYLNSLDDITDGASGADKIGSTGITGIVGTTVQAQLEGLRTLIDQAVLGQIVDGSITNVKLADDIKVGSLASLTTTDKSSVVAALNELKSTITMVSGNVSTAEGHIGDLASLTTTAKTSAVAAINEIDGDVGIISNLNTTVKTNLVNAINELVTINSTQNTNITNQTVGSIIYSYKNTGGAL